MSTLQAINALDGIAMPGIIYGTAWKKERTAELVEKALVAGFRGIDTAAQPKHYEEALVGVGLQRAAQHGLTRDMLYLQTKFTPLSSQDPERLPYTRTAAVGDQVAESFANSLRNLQTDYVDCLILHSPLASHAQTMQAWQAMEAIVQAGGARQLGISNCYDFDVMQDLYEDAVIKPTLVQNRFYKDTAYEVTLRKWCREQGIVFQSFWSLTANTQILGSETLRQLAGHYHKTPAQIFFRFLHQCGIVPLTGTTSEQHMREDLQIFEFSLTPEEINQVNKLLNV